MAIDKGKFLAKFIEEAKKHTAGLSSGIMHLEQYPGDQDMLHTVFRCAHTLKGSANMMNLKEISEFAHQIENILSLLRDEQIELDRNTADVLLKSTDYLSGMVNEAGQGSAASPPPDELVRSLAHLGGGQSREEEQPQQGSPSQGEPDMKPGGSRDVFEVKTAKLDELINAVGELSVWSQDVSSEVEQLGQLARKIKELNTSLEQSEFPVDPSVLEKSRVLRDTGMELADVLSRHSYTLGSLNGELKSMLISLRMVPLSGMFEQFPRLVRDLSSRFGKEIDISITGVETELDKSLIDMVNEALVHVIRNAVDHGIESPDVRKKLGKNERGSLTVSAGYTRGMCSIQVADDGAGISVQDLMNKGTEQGVLTRQQADSMGRNLSPAALGELLAVPGLTSAPLITDLSGRGVGMDVVRENIVEKLNGVIEVRTERGKGTEFIFKLPSTRAVMEVMMVSIGTGTAALPVNAVLQVFRLDAEKFIEVAQRQAVRLNEQIVPVVSLHELFGQKQDLQKSQHMLLLVATGSGNAGIIVDDIIKQDYYIIHSLPPHLIRTPWVTGCIAVGAYTLVNLLNTHRLMELSHQQEASAQKQNRTSGGEQEKAKILVADDSISTRDIEKSILESYGYEVELASDGQEAYETAMERSFDLIVTDIEMPRMDGLELTRALRKEKDYRHTPIILVTSRDREEDRIRGIDAGADAYIVKSAFDQENLIKTIKTLTGKQV